MRQKQWLPCALVWLLLLCAVLLPVSIVMKTVWNGQDVDWMGVTLIAAGPRSEILRGVCALLQQVCGGVLATALVLRLTLMPFLRLSPDRRTLIGKRTCRLHL